MSFVKYDDAVRVMSAKKVGTIIPFDEIALLCGYSSYTEIGNTTNLRDKFNGLLRDKKLQLCNVRKKGWRIVSLDKTQKEWDDSKFDKVTKQTINPPVEPNIPVTKPEEPADDAPDVTSEPVMSEPETRVKVEILREIAGVSIDDLIRVAEQDDTYKQVLDRLLLPLGKTLKATLTIVDIEVEEV